MKKVLTDIETLARWGKILIDQWEMQLDKKEADISREQFFDTIREIREKANRILEEENIIDL